MRFVHDLGGGGYCGGARAAAHGCFVVGQDVFEADVGLGHAEVGVLGVEDLDEFGGCVAHGGCDVDKRGTGSGLWVESVDIRLLESRSADQVRLVRPGMSQQARDSKRATDGAVPSE